MMIVSSWSTLVSKMQQKRNKRVSLVIPAYNEERHLGACLEAIARQTVAPFEVIVVDNNSTDRTVEVARAFPFTRIITEKKQGVLFARNAGFNAAQGDVIGRIDADSVLPPHWVEYIADFYSNPLNRTTAWSGGALFYDVNLPRLVSWTYNFMIFRFNWLLLGHTSLWGSNMALPTAVWSDVAPEVCQNEDIHEDLDLALHVHRHHYSVVYDEHLPARTRLRPIHAPGRARWHYLLMWPQTLRRHRKKTWPVCWFFGAFLLYCASFGLVGVERVARAVGRAPKGPR